MDLFESTVYTAQHEQASAVNEQSDKFKEPSVLDRRAQIIQPKPVNRVRTAYSHQQASSRENFRPSNVWPRIFWAKSTWSSLRDAAKNGSLQCTAFAGCAVSLGKTNEGKCYEKY